MDQKKKHILETATEIMGSSSGDSENADFFPDLELILQKLVDMTGPGALRQVYPTYSHWAWKPVKNHIKVANLKSLQSKLVYLRDKIGICWDSNCAAQLNFGGYIREIAIALTILLPPTTALKSRICIAPSKYERLSSPKW